MNYSSHLVLSMLLKNTCHMWYSSIFQKELKDVYRGEGSILMLLCHKLEQLHCSVISVWISSIITQEIILPSFYCISSFRFFIVVILVGLWVVCHPSTPVSGEFLMVGFVTSPVFLVHLL